LPGFKRIVPIKSNLNKNVIIPLVNYDDDFLKRKVKEGKSSGYVDIPFTKGDVLYLPTCKMFHNPDGKSLADYGIDYLDTIRNLYLQTRETFYWIS